MRASSWVVASFIASVLVAAPSSVAAGDEPTCDPGAPTGAPVLVSRAEDGGVASGVSDDPRISADGNLVSFQSVADDIGAGTGFAGAYLRDLAGGTTELLGVDEHGESLVGGSWWPSISSDGRLAVVSTYDEFQPEPTGLTMLRDRSGGSTTTVLESSQPALVSDDGGIVVFIDGMGGGPANVYALDVESSEIEVVSVDAAGEPQDDFLPHRSEFDLTPDGRYVVYSRTTTPHAVYLRDLDSGTTELVSVDSAEVPMARSSYSPAISDDGSQVVWISRLEDAPPGFDARTGIFLRDRHAGTTRMLIAGTPAMGTTIGEPAVSGDGRMVAFAGRIPRPVTGVPVPVPTEAVFVLDVATGAARMVSRSPSGELPLGIGQWSSPQLSQDGKRVAFQSAAVNLVPGDHNESTDVFVADVGRFPSLGPFEDVRGDHAFCADITWAAEEEITGGFPDGTYRPAQVVTRQAMAAFLYRFAGEPAFDAPDTPSFSDVPTSHLFYDEIEWLVAEGITGGFPDGTFGPGGPVSRGSMAAFLYRFAGEPPFDAPDTPTFPDVPTGHVFFDEVEWLAGEGITGGFPDNTFRPASVVSRGSMAAFLHRAA